VAHQIMIDTWDCDYADPSMVGAAEMREDFASAVTPSGGEEEEAEAETEMAEEMEEDAAIAAAHWSDSPFFSSYSAAPTMAELVEEMAHSDDDDVVRFIEKGGELLHGHWEKLKCGCEAFVLAWQTSGETTVSEAEPTWSMAPSPFSPCCGMSMMIVGSITLPDGTVKLADALVKRHSLGCPHFINCVEHLY